MRKVGKRNPPDISSAASPDRLREGAVFFDEVKKTFQGRPRLFVKGVFRYRTHEEANVHWEDAMARSLSGL